MRIEDIEDKFIKNVLLENKLLKERLNLEEKRALLLEKSRAAKETAINKASDIHKEYKKQVSTAIMTAFGLVIALAWKDVVSALIPSITTPGLLEKYPLLTSVYSAVILTVLAVVGIVLVSNWAKEKKRSSDKKKKENSKETEKKDSVAK